ncbi:hypothetical protein F5890DRAFT_1605036 [Lentinula detonsa]|uniref:Cytochrome b561 domain-containing protein n=1 Tax=Lentinula detonsa TaxID=2804962 RepID=A0AA38UQ76_9AGAR|nr:hypothetical protein F5890DRAFT_1605036 [Lentinula detonsa]
MSPKRNFVEGAKTARKPTMKARFSVLDGDLNRLVTWDNLARTNLIWAFGAQNPGSSAGDAPFQFHVDAGYAHFDLSKPISPSSDKVESSASTPSPLLSSLTSMSTIPLDAHQRMAFAHAVFCTTGFIHFLPAGVLVSRWVKTFTPAWHTAHWILQFVVVGFSIIIGLVFGVQSVNNGRHIEHLDDDHKKWGAALFALYVFQLKPTNSTGRLLQNYFYTVTGLILIGLGFYQVHSGYKNGWSKVIGRDDVMEGVNVVWYAWIVILPILYFAGLILLPKQLAQEAANRSLWKKCKGL